MRRLLNVLSRPIVFLGLCLIVQGCAGLRSSDQALRQTFDRAIAAGATVPLLDQSREILRRQPLDPELAWRAATALRLAGRCSEALTAFQSMLLPSHPHRDDALEALGLCALDRGELADAAQYFRQLLARDALRWRSLSALGVSVALQGDLVQAEDYLTYAQELSHGHPVVGNNLALVRAMRGDRGEAAAMLRRLMTQFPEHSRRHQTVALNLALCLGLDGKFDEARKEASRYLSGAALEHNMAIYAMLRGDKDKARQFLEQQLQHAPQDAVSWKLYQDLGA
jgi:Flp pilus assembly protein TadD